MLPKEQLAYFHRLSKPTTAGHSSINRTHDSEDFFEKLRVGDGQQYLKKRYKEQVVKNRHNKLLTEASQTQFRMTRLQQSVKKLRELDLENNRYRWVSPIHGIRKSGCRLTEVDLIGLKNQTPQVQTDENRESAKKVNICSSLLNCGEHMRSTLLPSRNDHSKRNKKIWRTNISALSRLTRQYQQLERAGKQVQSTTPMVVSSSEMRNRLKKAQGQMLYRSSSGEFLSEDRLKVAFHDYYQFFQENFRRDDSDLVRRLLNSLCSYGKLDIHCFIKFNSLFVTKEATFEEQVQFVLHLFFQPWQEQLDVESYSELLHKMILDSRKLSEQKLQKLYNSILRITAEGTSAVTRQSLYTTFCENQDITEVMMSLLQIT